MSKPVKLPSRTFESKKEAREYCSTLLNSTPLKQKVSDYDCQILSELVAFYHPFSEFKIANGIDSIYVDYAIGYERFKQRCFHIKRLDGSSTDFSYNECLNPSNKWKSFQQACRNTVYSQIRKFKQENATKHQLNYHVDHAYPFINLIKDFLIKYSLDYCKIDLIEVDNAQYIANRKVRNLFFSYHAKYASLQLLPAQENLSKGAKTA